MTTKKTTARTNTGMKIADKTMRRMIATTTKTKLVTFYRSFFLDSPEVALI
jgi:hypothetical protein